MKKLLSLIGVLLISSFLMFGCSSSGGGSSSELSGAVVVPEDTTVSSAKIINNSERNLLATTTCPNVPAGYAPLANATVIVYDVNGNQLGTVTTDSCGKFDITVSGLASYVEIVKQGYYKMRFDASNFMSSSSVSGQAVTVLPSNHSIKITSVQFVDEDEIAFTVVDNVTNKAILGLSSVNVDVKINNNNVGINKLNYSSTTDPASVMLILDASGSMSSLVYDNNTNKSYTRYYLTSQAVHYFLNNKNINDEVGVIVFSSNVDFIDNNSFTTLFNLNPVYNNFPPDGFGKDVEPFHLLADLYNPNSVLWGGPDNISQYTPKGYMPTVANYPWAGMTALWNATDEGLDILNNRNNKRKFIIVLTDGWDTEGGDVDDLIDKANNFDINVNTIGVGDYVDENNLRKIANNTSGVYSNVEGINVAGAFQSYQTMILYQYLLELASKMQSGDTLTINVNFGGLQGQFTILIP